MQTFVIAKVLVVNVSGEILTLRRSATDERRPLQWDFPGGFVDAADTITTAAVRETKEEAGLTIAEPRLVYAKSEVTPDHGSGTWLLFVAPAPADPQVTLSFEHDQFQWVKPADLLQQITYDRQQAMLRYVIENDLLH